MRRRKWAEAALPVMLITLAGGIVLSFAAAAESDHDLQAQAHRTLLLAASAERSQHARSGRYTKSIARLRRLNRDLAAEVTINGAIVRITRGPVAGSVRLRVTLGPGSLASGTLEPDGRLTRAD